jgi:tRNA (adenine22-N1)-methyltransferase
MKLSKRLEAVATLVDVGKRVIDVGCDHGYLDIYLTLNNENKCLATDINEKALCCAINNIKKFNLEDKIETKLTDGLKDIKINKKDNIVISGMGTNTIIKILNSNNLSNTLIISSNNHIDLLRKEIVKLGYYIDTELFIIDKKKPYVIIKFKRGFRKYNLNDFMFGPILKNNVQYRNYMIKKYKEIIKQVSLKKVSVKLKYLMLILKLKLLDIKIDL